MSQSSMEKLIKDFLNQVKEKLPEWLKSDKQELKDVLSELEEHIWDKAEELSEGRGATEDIVRMAIAHMGNPKEIAKEYKRRGTPKVYITEELWPIYTKALGILVGVVLAVNFIGFILGLIFSGFTNWDFNMTGILFGLAGVFTIVTVIFVALSMEGYLPEDLKSDESKKREQKELEMAQRKGWPISKKTGKPLKPFIQPAGMIIGGVIQMAIAIFFITLPFPDLIALMNQQFVFYIRIFGMFMMADGIIDLIRGIIGNKEVSTHQVLKILKISLSFVSIPLVWAVFSNPEMITIPYWNSDTGIGVLLIPEGILSIIRWVAVWIIVAVVIGCIADIVETVRLDRYKHTL